MTILRKFPRLAALLCVIGIGLAVPATVAQSQSAPVIQQIVVEGNQRIEAATVTSYLPLGVGDPADPFILNKSMREMFATGLFADVSMALDNGVLRITVEENPIINRVAFEGNDRIDDADLQAEIESRQRVVFTRTQVSADAARLLEVYRRSGRFAASVEPEIIELDQNRVDLVFTIDEGDRTGISRISFIGNREFSDGTLREEILTEESAFWRIFSSNDAYDPDRLAFDQELLRDFYLAEGYADFELISAIAELSPDGDGFFITFTLDEGERYQFGGIDLVSSLPDLAPDQLLAEVTTYEGDWYDASEVEQSVQNLTDRIGELGYAFVEITPRVDRDRDNLTVALTYDIQEGPRVYVERIEIVGNVRTEDEVIRREIALVEGDAFNSARVSRSQQNIVDLDYFDTVEISTQEGSAPDQTVLLVEVEEKSTGEFALGAGYSTIDGALADFSLRERNLLGKGQDLRLGLSLSGSRQEIELSFTEPYFLGRNLTAGFDIFRVTRDRQDIAQFDSEETGVTLRTGYRINNELSQSWSYTLRHDEISNVAPTASAIVQEAAGERLTSLIGQAILYDQRDSRIEPTEGYFVRFGTDLAGLGGDVAFLKATLGSGYYYTITDDIIASVSAEAGTVYGLGQDVDVLNRFYVGGRDLRGFQPGGIGPRDIVSGDALGGNSFATGSIEMTFPTGLPDELGVTAAVFADFGTLTGVDATGPNVVDTGSIRSAAGVGFIWDSPFGPVRVNWAYPLTQETYDETEAISLSFGTRF